MGAIHARASAGPGAETGAPRPVAQRARRASRAAGAGLPLAIAVALIAATSVSAATPTSSLRYTNPPFHGTAAHASSAGHSGCATATRSPHPSYDLRTGTARLDLSASAGGCRPRHSLGVANAHAEVWANLSLPRSAGATWVFVNLSYNYSAGTTAAGGNCSLNWSAYLSVCQAISEYNFTLTTCLVDRSTGQTLGCGAVGQSWVWGLNTSECYAGTCFQANGSAFPLNYSGTWYIGFNFSTPTVMADKYTLATFLWGQVYAQNDVYNARYTGGFASASLDFDGPGAGLVISSVGEY